MDKLLKYTIQLAMLSSLFEEKLITQKEYLRIKAELKKNNRVKPKLCG